MFGLARVYCSKIDPINYVKDIFFFLWSQACSICIAARRCNLTYVCENTHFTENYFLPVSSMQEAYVFEFICVRTYVCRQKHTCLRLTAQKISTKTLCSVTECIVL